MPITRKWQRDLDRRQIDPASLVRGMKVRRIDEPHVVLHVREIDTEGTGNDKVPKALCFNSYGHGKWMPLVDLEAAS